MPRNRVATLLCLCLLAVACGQPPAVKQSTSVQAAAANASGIVGTWQLATRTVSRGNGDVIVDPVLGAEPLGRLFYDAGGRMALQMMREGRTAAISQPVNPADAGNARVVLGYDSYFGTYTVDEAAGTITHKVQASLFPEDLGKDFVRRFTLADDTLTLSFTSQAADGSTITRTLVFRRAA